MQCNYTDCFAWHKSGCNSLLQIQVPTCSFYKPLEQLLEENEYMDDDTFLAVFGRTLTDKRKEKRKVKK